MRALIEAKLKNHKDQITRLRLCYVEEMTKGWWLRNKSCLVFLWKELSVYEHAALELEDLLSHLNESHHENGNA